MNKFMLATIAMASVLLTGCSINIQAPNLKLETNGNTISIFDKYEKCRILEEEVKIKERSNNIILYYSPVTDYCIKYSWIGSEVWDGQTIQDMRNWDILAKSNCYSYTGDMTKIVGYNSECNITGLRKTLDYYLGK